MLIKGNHITIDAFHCDPQILDNENLLETEMMSIANRLNMTVLNRCFHKFDPYGVTGVLILSTSHMSIHTWPEKGYAALDIYTCGKMHPSLEVKNILSFLSAEYGIVYDLFRGEKEISQPDTSIIRL